MLRRTTLAVLLVGVGLMPMAGRAADNPVSQGWRRPRRPCRGLRPRPPPSSVMPGSR